MRHFVKSRFAGLEFRGPPQVREEAGGALPKACQSGGALGQE
jgi:hypothetical protein